MEKINEIITNERIKTELVTHDFYYELPEELIAQFPSAERDKCRLMLLDKKTGEVQHKIFSDIIFFDRATGICAAVFRWLAFSYLHILFTLISIACTNDYIALVIKE